MCAGDLGMYRVMPWAYPPISGGTSGGFSTNPDQSEEGGSGPDTLVLNSDSSISIADLSTLAYNGSDTSKSDTIRVTIWLQKIGLQNVVDLSSLKFTFNVERMEGTISGTKYDFMTIATVTKNSTSLTPPLDTMVNGTQPMTFDYKLATTVSYGTVSNKVVSGSLVVDTLNADGSIIRSQSFPVSVGV